jgi:tetratricopeptide (TPR) repeat protein
LGASVEPSLNGVTVRQLTPGGPAERAGIKVGDEIINFGGKQYLVVSEFVRAFRLAGGGNTVEALVFPAGGGNRNVQVTLDAGSGDAWGDFDRYDLVSQLLRSTGKDDAARMVESLGVVKRVFNSATPDQRQQILVNVESAFKVFELFNSLVERARRGELTAEQIQYQLSRQMAVNMDQAFGFADHPATDRFERAARQGALDDALAMAGSVIEERSVPLITDAITKLWSRQDYISVPPELIEETAGTTLEVAPEFIAVDGHSQLGRVLYDSDYIIKRVLNTPSLKEKVPRYQTEFAFEHEHPQFSRAREISQGRIWVSIDHVEAKQSTSGNTLELRDVRMRFNVREKEGKGEVAAPPGGYEDFLTSLYDDFSVQFAVLHELSECAKLAAAANWLLRSNPTLRLPVRGRAAWQPPAKAPGVVFLSWTMNPTTDSVNASMVSAGGVCLGLPLPGLPRTLICPKRGEFAPGSDASVVDRSHSSLIAPAVIPTLIDPSVLKGMSTNITTTPQPMGWINSETDGGRTVTAVSIMPTGDERDAVASVQLRRSPEDLAVVLWNQKDLDGAEQELRKNIQAASDAKSKSALKMMLAQVLHEKGEDSAAIAELNEATALDPTSKIPLLLAAMDLAQTGDLKGAEEALRKYVAADPSNEAAAKLLTELQNRQNGVRGSMPLTALALSAFPRQGGGAVSEADEAAKAEANRQFHDWQIERFKMKGLVRNLPPLVTVDPKFQNRPELQPLFAQEKQLIDQVAQIQKGLDDINLRKSRGEGNTAELDAKSQSLKGQETATLANLQNVEKQIEKKTKDFPVTFDEAAPSQNQPPKNKPSENQTKPDARKPGDKP